MRPLERACDRCAELKTQCSGHNPCDRCRRIEVLCTRDRPVLNRGRPKKARSTAVAHPLRSSSIVAGFSSGSSSSNDPAESPLSSAATLLSMSDQLPLSGLEGAEMLESIFDVVHSVGILNAFRRNHHWLIAHPSRLFLAERDVELSFLRSRAIISTLFACCIAFNPPAAASAIDSVFLENCRIYALADIPILAWKSRTVNRSDIYSLYLLSNLSFLQESMTEMAARWAMLAETLTLTEPTFTRVPVAAITEVDRRIYSSVAINTEVQRLLYNRPHRSGELRRHVPDSLDSSTFSDSEPLMRPEVPDSVWHQVLSHTPESYGSASPHPVKLNQGFFDLFLPLWKHLNIVHSFPQCKGKAQMYVARSMEHYFISFPTALMELDKVGVIWQLEAMIWFHGIYLLLSCGPDLLRILRSPDFTDAVGFRHAAEHAILLGDILPYLGRMEFAVLRVSHATIYFITLSAAVHVSVIQYAYVRPSSSPPLLLESAQSHLKVLNAILESNQTCDHRAVGSVAGILSNLLATEFPSGFDLQASAIRDLKHYRWVPGGRGLIRLSESAAEDLLENHCYNDNVAVPSVELLSELDYILDPRSRIVQSGTFDLSILY